MARKMNKNLRIALIATAVIVPVVIVLFIIPGYINTAPGIPGIFPRTITTLQAPRGNPGDRLDLVPANFETYGLTPDRYGWNNNTSLDGIMSYEKDDAGNPSLLLTPDISTTDAIIETFISSTDPAASKIDITINFAELTFNSLTGNFFQVLVSDEHLVTLISATFIASSTQLEIAYRQAGSTSAAIMGSRIGIGGSSTGMIFSLSIEMLGTSSKIGYTLTRDDVQIGSFLTGGGTELIYRMIRLRTRTVEMTIDIAAITVEYT